jgi:hypothetical protein
VPVHGSDICHRYVGAERNFRLVGNTALQYFNIHYVVIVTRLTTFLLYTNITVRMAVIPAETCGREFCE